MLFLSRYSISCCHELIPKMQHSRFDEKMTYATNNNVYIKKEKDFQLPKLSHISYSRVNNFTTFKNICEHFFLNLSNILNYQVNNFIRINILNKVNIEIFLKRISENYAIIYCVVHDNVKNVLL